MTKLEKLFKLVNSINIKNLFNSKNNIQKYDNINEILKEYIGKGIEYYIKRKSYR